MSSAADQRRKRKRILRPSLDSSLLLCLRHLFAVRSLVLCFTFLTLLYLLPHSIPLINSSAFHPVLVVSSSLSLLSSSSFSTTVKSVEEFGNFLLPPKLEGRVLFPDHVLFLVSGKKHGLVSVVDSKPTDALECVYYGLSNFTGNNPNSIVKKVLSLDEYDGFRAIVRCPILSAKHSGSQVGLRCSGKNGIWMNNQTCSWDNVAYAAVLDKGSVVVFVKGLNLRPDRVSDPRLISCHFGVGGWGRGAKFLVRTKALTAAQEVVRCPLPMSLRSSVEKGIRVTVGVRQSARVNIRTLMPSVATIFGSQIGGEERKISDPVKKHELCACTMVWNQASAIREWVMYHSWLGVGKWFVYDNNSDDGTSEVVDELDRANYNVTRHVWPWIKTQEAGFSHCVMRARDECNWVAFMDVDEYFYFPYSTPKRPRFRKSRRAGRNALLDLVGNFSSPSQTTIAEIRTTCHSFGPSGLGAPPPQGVTVGYTCRLQSPERHKSIVRPDAVDPTLLNVVHHFHLKNGFKYINLPQNTAVINHYKYQVWEVFRAKFYRRVATYVVDWQQNQNEGSRDRVPGLGTEAIEPSNWPQKFCEVWDSGLRDFVLANLADASTGLLPWERPDLDT